MSCVLSLYGNLLRIKQLLMAFTPSEIYINILNIDGYLIGCHISFGSTRIESGEFMLRDFLVE